MPKLTQVLDLDQTGFQTGLNRAQSRLKKFSGMAKGFLGAAGIAGGLSLLSRSAIETGSKISDLAKQTRTTTEGIQVLTEASRDAGVEMGILERALRNITLRTQQAKDGNKRYAESIDRLNLNIEEFSKLPTERKLEQIAKAYQDAGKSQEAFNDVSIILGERAGPALLEVIERLASEGFDNLSTSMKNANRIMTEDTVASLDKAADKIEEWKQRSVVAMGAVLGQVDKVMANFRKMGEMAIDDSPETLVEQGNIRRLGDRLRRDVTGVGSNTEAQSLAAQIGKELQALLATDGRGRTNEAFEREVMVYQNALKLLTQQSDNLVKTNNDRIKAEKEAAKATKERAAQEKKNAAIQAQMQILQGLNVSGQSMVSQFREDQASRNERLSELNQRKSDLESSVEQFGNRLGAVTSSSLASVGGGGGVFAGAARIPEKQLDELKEINKQLTDIKQSGGGNLTT